MSRKRLRSPASGSLRAAVYARRSTDEHQAASLDVQLEEARRFCSANGWSVAEEHVYLEDAVSRAEFKRRPALLSLINAAESRAFDVVVTRDETRIGGDMVRTSLVISDLLDAGVRLFFYFEAKEVTLDNAVDKFMLAARNFAAELEREKLSQRTYEHLMTKARKGFVAGGSVFGYANREVRIGDKRSHVVREIDAKQAVVVREIFQMYADGMGLKAIAKKLNSRSVPSPRAGNRGTGSWAPSSVRPILHRQLYVGQITWGRSRKTYKGGTKIRVERDPCDWVVADAPHLRIIPDELWTAAQARTATREHPSGKGKHPGRRPKYMMSQLARCGSCGGPIKVTNGKQGKHTIKVYVCGYRHERGPAVCDVALRRPVERVNEAVVEWVRRKLVLDDLFAEIRKNLESTEKARSADAPKLEAEARKLRAEIGRLVDAVATGTGATEPLVSALETRQERLSAVDAELRAMKAAPEAISLELRRMEAQAKQRLADLAGAFERNPELAREALLKLFPEPLRFTALKTDQGQRFLIEGEAVVGLFSLLEGAPAYLRPNVASPTGFEPVLQP
jgi:site-specific DNA recombinase